MDPQSQNPQNLSWNNQPQNFNQQPSGGMPQMTPEQYMAWYQQQQMMMQQQNPQMQQPMGGMPMNQGMQQPPVNPMQQPMGGMPMNQGFQQPMGGMPQPMNGMPMNQGMPVTPLMPNQPMQAAPNPASSQPMMVDGKLNESLMQRDPNVLNFMMQAVREKFKNQQITEEFVNTEATRLYDAFGENLVSHFEPMLAKEQIEQFDGLLQSGASQDQLLEFLMGCIPDLTSKIEQVLLAYKDKYLLEQ